MLTSVSPGFSFEIEPFYPYKFKKNMDVIDYYVNGYLADSAKPAPLYDSTISSFTVFAQYLNQSYTYALKFCARDGNGIFPWYLYDHSGNTLLKWGIDTVSHHKCITITIPPLMGTAAFSGIGVTDNKNGIGTFNPTVSGPGIFDITYSWNNWQGCSSSYTQTIKVIGPKANAGKDTAICRGTQVKIGGKPTGSGGAPIYKYGWSPTTGLNKSTSANPTATPNNTTAYVVTVTDNNGRGCKGIDTINVFIKNNPIVSVSRDSAVCSGTKAGTKSKRRSYL